MPERFAEDPAEGERTSTGAPAKKLIVPAIAVLLAEF
jgi:hypothetical protein